MESASVVQAKGRTESDPKNARRSAQIGHRRLRPQVEFWFSKIERDVIARGVFTSVADLAPKLCKYIRAYGKSAKPFRWTYADTARRTRPWLTI